jgi:uncharacterized protein YukJ
MAKSKKKPKPAPGKTRNQGQPGQNVWFHVLKCRPVKYQTKNNHFQVLVDCDSKQFWFTVNVRYVQQSANSDNVLYLTDDNYKHPITQKIKESQLPWGFTQIPEKPGGIALDYIQGNLVNLKDMKVLENSNSTHTDLSELLASYINRVRRSTDAIMYVFGSKFPLPNQAENQGSNPFSLSPNIGLHDVHMNQGSIGSHASSNSSWQDGGILIHFPSTDTWAAIYLAFETQVKSLLKQELPKPGDEPAPVPSIGESTVKIVAAMVNPSGDERSKENVYLINITNQPIDLAGWFIEDTSRQKQKLSNVIMQPYQVSVISVDGLELSNKGGIINLYDKQMKKIHGVSYTKEVSAKEDVLITF